MQGETKFSRIEVGARVTFTASEGIWIKDYSRIELASQEAVELGLLPAYEKQTLEANWRSPSVPDGWSRRAEPDLAALTKAGFMPHRAIR
jgi:hypothetical protein